MNEHNSRRDFLKISGLAVGAGLLTHNVHAKSNKMEGVIIGHNYRLNRRGRGLRGALCRR